MARTSEVKATWHHKGGTITIDNNAVFRWAYDDDGGSAPTLEAAKKEIDRAVADKEKAARVPVNIPAVYVFNGEIRSITVTGLHASLGELLTKPKIEKDPADHYGYRTRREQDANVYADTPEIRQMLADRIAAQAILDALKFPLEQATVSSPNRYQHNGLAGATKALNEIGAKAAKAHRGMKEKS